MHIFREFSKKLEAGVSARKEHAADRPWMKHFGSLRNFHDERKEIESRIEEEFSAISSLVGKLISSATLWQISVYTAL